MNLCVIPARGGSKRIPHKNIKDFNGLPMIAYAINAAREANVFDKIVVSTDDQEVAKIANKYGAETPFWRPSELSDDFASTVSVVSHATQACESVGFKPDYVCCIYPGVPLLKAEDLWSSLEILRASDAEYCFSIVEFAAAIQRALRMTNSGHVRPYQPQYQLVRTQDLETAYHDAGQFYWGKTSAWVAEMLMHDGGLGYVIPKWRAIDIDTPDDWKKAELLCKAAKLYEEA